MEKCSQAALGEASEKLQSIKQDLMAKVNEQMGGEEAFLNQLGDWQGQSDSLDKQLEELLKSKIEDSLKDKLKAASSAAPKYYWFKNCVNLVAFD